jgi:hypothetical protein
MRPGGFTAGRPQNEVEPSIRPNADNHALIPSLGRVLPNRGRVPVSFSRDGLYSKLECFR